jgi:hypothetical protein
VSLFIDQLPLMANRLAGRACKGAIGVRGDAELV